MGSATACTDAGVEERFPLANSPSAVQRSPVKASLHQNGARSLAAQWRLGGHPAGLLDLVLITGFIKGRVEEGVARRYGVPNYQSFRRHPRPVGRGISLLQCFRQPSSTKVAAGERSGRRPLGLMYATAAPCCKFATIVLAVELRCDLSGVGGSLIEPTRY